MASTAIDLQNLNNESEKVQLSEAETTGAAVVAETRNEILELSPLEQCSHFADRIKNESDMENRLKIMQEAAEAGHVKLRIRKGKESPWVTVEKKDKELKNAQKSIVDAYYTANNLEQEVAEQTDQEPAESQPNLKLVVEQEADKAEEVHSELEATLDNETINPEQPEELTEQVSRIENDHEALYSFVKDCHKKGIVFMLFFKKGNQKKWKAVVPNSLKENGTGEEVKASEALCDAINTQKRVIWENNNPEAAKAQKEEAEKKKEKQAEIEAIKARIDEAAAQVKTAISFRNDEKTGILDICEEFMEEDMLSRNQKGYFEYNPKKNWAKPLAEAANERIKKVKTYRWLRNQNNGFFYDQDGVQYAFQLNVKHGEGADIAVISNLVELKEGAPFKEGEISCADIEEGSFLEWAAREMIKNPKGSKKPAKKKSHERAQKRNEKAARVKMGEKLKEAAKKTA
jgi:hypothetical protein